MADRQGLLAFVQERFLISEADFNALPVDQRIQLGDQYTASRTGNNCVVFIMWFGYFLVTLFHRRADIYFVFCRNSFNDTRALDLINSPSTRYYLDYNTIIFTNR